MKKETRNTIDNVPYKNTRCIGNSTRQVDKAIQLLFDDYIVKVIDHWKYGKDLFANQFLFDKILNRLSLEHNLSYLKSNNKIRIDKDKLELELINQDEKHK